MTKYRFTLLAKDRCTSSDCIIDADDDDEVRDIADDLIKESVFHMVEVWRETKLVYRTAKFGANQMALN